MGGGGRGSLINFLPLITEGGGGCINKTRGVLRVGVYYIV